MMTGTEPYLASSSTSDCLKVRIIMPSTMRDITLAVSDIGSPRPSCISLPLKNMACPPSCCIPVSKETRVRVEDLVNIIASVLPSSNLWGIWAFCLAFKSRARESTCNISSLV